MVVLDTDHLSLLQRTSSAEGARLRDRLHLIRREECAATLVTFEEQVRGRLAVLRRARTVSQMVAGFGWLRTLLQDYCGMAILGFDSVAGQRFEQIEGLRLRIGTKDAQIAAIVLANDAVLLSRNLQHFQRILGLKVKDWTQ
jgi:tRNA(fMet)-specific endonuclease VapC